MTQCECYGYLSADNPRLTLWQTIMGQQDPHIPIKCPLQVSDPKLGAFWEGDTTRLSTEQQEQLIKIVAEKFRRSRKQVEEDIRQAGNMFPVQVDGISICAMHTVMMAD
jgi:hypothetical protein